MTNQFQQRVLTEGIVDTRNYRYIVRGDHTTGQYGEITDAWQTIYRLPISDLDTTAAIDGWVKVAEIH